MSLIDLLLHRVPWNGDKIRLYDRTFKVGDDGKMAVDKDTLRGEYVVKMENGDVQLPSGGYVRGDRPKWSARFGCWEYYYSASGGE